MSGTNLEELPDPFERSVERTEVVDFALGVMTPSMGGPGDSTLPECVDGAEAARLIARRYDMSERQAQRYVARARELIAARFQADLPTRANLLSSVSLAVVREAYKDREWSAVNGAVKNLCAIYGIDAKIVVKGDGMNALLDAVKATPGERDSEIARLEAKEREDAAGGADPR